MSPSEFRRRRRGNSIVEVLFAIGIATIGLAGSVAVLQVANATSRRGQILDALGPAARTLFHEFDSRGMRRPDRWIAYGTKLNEIQSINYDSTNYSSVNSGNVIYPWSEYQKFQQSRSVSPFNGRDWFNGVDSFCIDPRFVAANFSATGVTPAGAARFPVPNSSGTLASSNVAMWRVSLWNGLTGTAAMSLPMADSIFTLSDDLTIDRSTADRSLPATQRFAQLPLPAVGWSKRETGGHFSWMATLVPKLNLYGFKSPLVSPPASGPFSDEYVLSIVVFFNRPADLLAVDVLHERTLEAWVANGSTGGEIIVHWTMPQTSQNDKDAAEMLKLRPQNWILLAGARRLDTTVGGTNKTIYIPRFQWYRVSNCEHEPVYNSAPAPANVFSGAGYEVEASLMGQDWDMNLCNPLSPGVVSTPLGGQPPLGTAQVIIVEGVIGVYEKTIRLDYGVQP